MTDPTYKLGSFITRLLQIAEDLYAPLVDEETDDVIDRTPEEVNDLQFTKEELMHICVDAVDEKWGLGEISPEGLGPADE